MSDQKNKRILVVEDEMSLLKALVTKLENFGYGVLQARDGVEGYEMALNEKPDLILLDIKIPKMDGVAMAKKLREDEWGKTAKIIILTNLSDSNEIKEALDAGVYEYLVKSDWKIEDIVKKVEEKIG